MRQGRTIGWAALAIALLGLLNLFGLLFVQMIDRGDLGHHPETDTRDQ